MKSINKWFNNNFNVNKQPTKLEIQKAKFNDLSDYLFSFTEKTIAGALLLGFNHAQEKIALADVPPLPFEEAIDFLKGKTSMTKKEWSDIEPKLRFRAFTVARLAELDHIEKIKNKLISNLENGKSFVDSWNEIKDNSFSPGYWETVYRTNIQSAYNAGRLIQHKNNTPPAWELLVIEDGRTSDTCKGIVAEIGNGKALPSNHYFWKKVGFPPYHFNCRTTFRAVYNSEINDGTTKLLNTPLKDINFKPQSGFGGQILSTGSWWKLTNNMLRRAKKYGVKKEFDVALKNIKPDLKDVKNDDIIPSSWQKIKGEHSAEYDLKMVNPNFSTGEMAWTHNCQRCVPTYEMRRRGFDVTAMPRLENETLAMYCNATKIFKGQVHQTRGSGIRDIKKLMKQWGDGSRGQIFIFYKGGGGHTIVVEQVKGKAIFRDPQTNETMPFPKSIVKSNMTSIKRIDNAEPTKLIQQCCKSVKE